jgi:hypothetical protein
MGVVESMNTVTLAGGNKVELNEFQWFLASESTDKVRQASNTCPQQIQKVRSILCAAAERLLDWWDMAVKTEEEMSQGHDDEVPIPLTRRGDLPKQTGPLNLWVPVMLVSTIVAAIGAAAISNSIAAGVFVVGVLWFFAANKRVRWGPYRASWALECCQLPPIIIE